jgi:hypothetical protein
MNEMMADAEQRFPQQAPTSKEGIWRGSGAVLGEASGWPV